MIQTLSLKYFAEIARCGSVRQASEALFVAPSAISRQIVNLEQEFGTELFDRSPRGMVLTAAGRLLMAFVQDGETRSQSVRAAIDDLSNLRRGLVRVAFVEAASSSFLPDIIAAFSAQFPQIEFRLSVWGTAQIVEAVVDQSADIGLAFNVLNRDDIILHGRIPQPLQLICDPGHALAGRASVAIADLREFRAAVPDKSFGIRYLIDKAVADAGEDLNIAYEANSLQTIKSLVRNTDVIGFMPPMTFERELALGWLQAVPVADPASQAATIDVVTSRNRKLPVAAAAFLKHLLQTVRPTPA